MTAVEYIARLFAESLKWEARWSPGFLDFARQEARRIGISQEVVATAHRLGFFDVVPS